MGGLQSGSWGFKASSDQVVIRIQTEALFGAVASVLLKWVLTSCIGVAWKSFFFASRSVRSSVLGEPQELVRCLRYRPGLVPPPRAGISRAIY